MTASDYILSLRKHVGHEPLLLPSATIAVRDGDRWLVGLHADHDRWLFPGGAIDPGERPADAAVREVFEETGLVVELTGLLGVFGGGPKHRVTYPNGDVVDYITALFEAEVVGGSLVADDHELVEMRWHTMAELLQLPVMPWMADALKAMQEQRRFEPASWTPQGAPPSP